MTIKIKYLGHASFQIRTESTVIYIDLAENAIPSEKADIVLVTHSHGDHCDSKLINKVRSTDTLIIAPANCQGQINQTIISLEPGQEKTVNAVKICAVHAYNEKRFRSPGNPFHPKGFGVGYIVSLEGKVIYHAGDTDFIKEMRDLGHIDVALLPIGGKYTMEVSDGADAALAIKPKFIIPHHHWAGQFGQTPEAFKAKVEANSDIKVIALKANEEFQLPD